MPVDAAGFLDARAAVRARIHEAQPGDLVSLAAAAEAQALVMLGEPGLGKSTALRQIARDLEAAGEEVVWLDGANVVEETFADEIGIQLARLPLEGGPAATRSQGFTVLLDALDESAMVRRIPRQLLQASTGRDLSSFRLIVGCRTADVPADLDEVLGRLFDDDVAFTDLAPLRMEDAVGLASDAGAHGERLIDIAVRLGAGSLAAAPLTLGLLVREWLKHQTLDASARELFALGVIALLDTVRTPEAGSLSSTVRQREAVAERIAAVMLLSGKRTIFVGSELFGGQQDLRLSDIADGAERTASGRFSVTPTLIRETLATALFTDGKIDRQAFVHASQAAYLAARYLSRREPAIPRRQLEGLLLVAGPDGSRTIPIPLREVAAWLASFDAGVGEWLAAIDPESFLGHEPYLEPDEVREVVAGSLLDRAAELELGSRAWRRGIDLAHPGLATQVLAVLNDAVAQPADWNDFARCRTALRLAMHATSPGLTDRLLQIAASPDWNSHMGSLAAKAALKADTGTAQPRLLDLLGALGDPVFAQARDPDDELRGTLLSALWPDHISTVDLLPALKPRRSSVIGAYWGFLHRFPGLLADTDDLAVVLRWGAESVQRDDDSDALPERDETGLVPRDAPVGALDAQLAEGLVDRALGGEASSNLISLAAALTWPRLVGGDPPALPPSLDEAAVDRSTVEIRRDFAEAMLRHRLDDDPDIYYLVHGWRASSLAQSNSDGRLHRRLLLDADDFTWAVERAHGLEPTEPRLASGFAELAGFLFNPFNNVAFELGSELHDTIVWRHIAHWFEPIERDSDLASRLRQQQQRARALQTPDQKTVDTARARRENLLSQYAAVVQGDSDQFWQLAWSLQFDPDTARGPRLLGDRLLGFPGVSILPTDAPAELLSGARAFLLHQHDHADAWLGTDRYDNRAWAGYLALVLLDEADELSSVPPPRLTSWEGAILWFWSVPAETGDRERKSRLLASAVAADASRMAELLPRYVRGHVRRGDLASELQAFDPASVRALQPTWTSLVTELHAAIVAPNAETPPDDARAPLTGLLTDEAGENARHTWQRMLQGLALADPAAAEELISSWVAAADSPTAISLAALSVAVILSAEPTAWRRLYSTVQADDELARQVAAAIVADHHTVHLNAELDEHELRDLYLWLSTIYPPEADEPEQLGGGWVTPAAQARRWRDDILTAIADRGTDDAVRVLSGLHQQLPTRIVVLSNLVRARVATFASAWQPPSPAEVQSLLEDERRRLVRSGEELSLLIQDELQEIETEFIRTGQLLWDRLPRKTGVKTGPRPWQPKPEGALSAFLAHDLQLRLRGRGVAVHREVLVKPTDAYGAGERPDLLIEARTRAADHGLPAVHRVAIEVKGAWNTDVLTAQHDQLASRYLPEADTDVGLYIVGWYPVDLWDKRDYRRRRASKTTSAELLRDLTSQADEIRATSPFAVTPVVLTIPRPRPNQPAGTH